MKSQNPLDSLVRARPGPAPRKSVAWRSLVLVLAFLAGIVLVFSLVFGDRLLPRVPVRVAAAVLLEGGEADVSAAVDAGPGPMISQASGWIEPDPYPIRVPVETDGFVETVDALAGDSVRRGQLLATLDPSNHLFRVAAFAAEVDGARAELAARDVRIRDASSEVVQAEAELEGAEALLVEARDRARRLHSLDASDVSAVELVAADRGVTESRAERTIVAARVERARFGVERERAEADRIRARIRMLEADADQARLDLARTRVTAPVDGIVLERIAAPGMKRRAAMDDPDSATIVTLYDPDRLQARVDVPLSDVGVIVTGMTAHVTTSAFADRTFTGRVTRITGEADIARNTLQVKVALEAPDPRIRPEMLCRVEFLASPSLARAGGARSRSVWVPVAALHDREDNRAVAWVIDPVLGTADSRELVLDSGEREGRIRIRDGLRPGEQVVIAGAERLRSGSRVAVEKEDTR